MNALEIHESARKLYQTHGDKTDLEPAQKARELADNSNVEAAEDWRQIRAAIAGMRGSHVS